jgi:small subunit ribosomal protein S11
MTTNKKYNSPEIHVQCTSNNTIVSVVNTQGKLLSTASCGYFSYTGSKKGTSTAAQQTVLHLAEQVPSLGEYGPFVVKVKGIGKGRSSVIKELSKAGLRILTVLDTTSNPYNGCKARKPKR